MALTEATLRQIVREEISGRDDKSQQLEIKVDGLSSLPGEVSSLKDDLRRFEVRFEDFDDKLDGIAEMLEVGLDLRQDSKQLDDRVTSLESDMSLVKSVLLDKPL